MTNKIVGALVVKTLRSLEKSSQLTESDLPDLELGLERLARWGIFAETELGLKSPYLTVVKGYGKKLYGDRTMKERAKMQASRKRAYKRFLQDLSKSERKERETQTDGSEEVHEELEDPWKGARKRDAMLQHPDFNLKVVWMDYLT